jgi:hypothetical protein
MVVKSKMIATSSSQQPLVKVNGNIPAQARRGTRAAPQEPEPGDISTRTKKRARKSAAVRDELKPREPLASDGLPEEAQCVWGKPDLNDTDDDEEGAASPDLEGSGYDSSAIALWTTASGVNLRKIRSVAWLYAEAAGLGR